VASLVWVGILQRGYPIFYLDFIFSSLQYHETRPTSATFVYFALETNCGKSRDRTSHGQPQRAVTATAFSFGESCFFLSLRSPLFSPLQLNPFSYHLRVSGTAGCPAPLHSPSTRYSLLTGSSIPDQPP
jgi:hypothetical protein